MGAVWLRSLVLEKALWWAGEETYFVSVDA